jgi:hypothetical protein
VPSTSAGLETDAEQDYRRGPPRRLLRPPEPEKHAGKAVLFRAQRLLKVSPVLKRRRDVMDSQDCEVGAAAPHPVIELPNGDVWVAATEVPGGRRFRRHLGHVVEVFDNGRIRRVGPGLRYSRPWLLADGPLESVIESALLDMGESGAGTWAEPLGAAGRADAGSGLLARLGSFLHRTDTAVVPDEAPPPWRDTLPWTRFG